MFDVKHQAWGHISDALLEAVHQCLGSAPTPGCALLAVRSGPPCRVLEAVANSAAGRLVLQSTLSSLKWILPELSCAHFPRASQVPEPISAGLLSREGSFLRDPD